MDDQTAHRVLDAFRTSVGTGSLRFAKKVDGTMTVGEEICLKTHELSSEVREALGKVSRFLDTPRFEVVCVGPDFIPDRIYVYRRILGE